MPAAAFEFRNVSLCFVDLGTTQSFTKKTAARARRRAAYKARALSLNYDKFSPISIAVPEKMTEALISGRSFDGMRRGWSREADRSVRTHSGGKRQPTEEVGLAEEPNEWKSRRSRSVLIGETGLSINDK